MALRAGSEGLPRSSKVELTRMKVIYRFDFPWTTSRGAKLESLELAVKAPKPPPEIAIGVSEAEEGQPGCDEACTLVREWGGTISCTTKFARAEIEAAEHCFLRGRHFNGYPQPEEDFRYCDTTYKGHCENCGTSLAQIAPFRVRKSLKWGRNAFLQLFWVVDEYFMPTAVWETTLAPLGIEARPVEDTKGQVLEGIVQLRVDTRQALDLGDSRGEICAACGRERYSTHIRGFLPPPKGSPDLPIFRSAQFFGSGGMGFNEIVVRHDVVQAVTSSGLRGLEFVPCAPAVGFQAPE